MAAKLFLVTRRDLPVGQQAVQAAHALREFTAHFPEEDRHWYETSNHLAILVVENEKALHDLALSARRRGLRYAPFREPDRSDELTALALEPKAKAVCRHLPLAFT